MEQLTLTIFDTEPKKIGLLHRCHLYKSSELAYTAFPSLKGMKLLRIKPGADMVLNLTVADYERFKADEGLEEKKP